MTNQDSSLQFDRNPWDKNHNQIPKSLRKKGKRQGLERENGESPNKFVTRSQGNRESHTGKVKLGLGEEKEKEKHGGVFCLSFL